MKSPHLKIQVPEFSASLFTQKKKAVARRAVATNKAITFFAEWHEENF
jgi:hypothetical protein